MPNGTTAIRAVIGLFIGAVLLCGWIILRNGDDAPDVTRATTVDLTEPTPQQITPAPAAMATAAPRPAQNAAAEDVRNAIQLALAPAQELPKADAVANIAAQALADLQKAQASVAPDTAVSAADDLNQSVLDHILKFRGQGGTEAPSLTDAVSQAMNTAAMDEYTLALIEAARAEGIAVDKAAFQTEDGTVDTRVLLSQIVAQAAQAQGTAKTTPTARPEAIGGEGVELYTVQTASGTEMHQFYTVQAGDSLGFIAQKFYGDAGLYNSIWQANRQILSSPDQIRKGQRLRIPAL